MGKTSWCYDCWVENRNITTLKQEMQAGKEPCVERIRLRDEKMVNMYYMYHLFHFSGLNATTQNYNTWGPTSNFHPQFKHQF